MKFTMSGNLLRFSNFRDQIEVSGATIEEGVGKLIEACPQLRPVLLDAKGQLRAVHRLFCNGEMVLPAELGAPRQASDEISILTAIAGG